MQPSVSWYLNWLNIALRLVKFGAFVIIAYIIYDDLLSRILTRDIHIVSYILFWIFTAYIALPWLNRHIARLYVPDYFIGRSRTGDGLLGDPVNIAIVGTRADLQTAMEQAGWTLADPVSFQTSRKIIVASLTGRSYKSAPVSPLYLFGEKQDLAFEREVNNNPRRRHHVRFWKTPAGWRLPGGASADWLGAATFDRNVGLSLFTGQITHKIDANVDIERDYVLQTLLQSPLLRSVTRSEHFTDSYHARSGGGDMIRTDGALPFVTVGPKEAA